MDAVSDPAKSIFLNALEIPSVDERQAYVAAHCGDDAALRQKVEELLAHHAGLAGFLEPGSALAAGLTAATGAERPGAVIGPYKLLELIGEGGMGTVWMAEQTEPIQRRVALKIVKEGMDSKQVLTRFEHERHALALMEHPNIAKVLDAGRTPLGRPYFVMELVKGQSITKCCDDKRLGVRQRLELFADVCRAVQHAHQKGIIHRDLKPSNVLVAPFDGRPVVKVIDFGVAKATGQRLIDATLFTGFGSVVGTPEYMSPEQAEVNNQDIDTRSDVYSLGVLLYELLTGSTPLTRKRIREAALLEVLRVIREEEPPRPSTRLSESKDALPSISAQRQIEPAKLTKLVRGELDWIVMKALDKDRNRRYETANGFAMDVQRYLADEPVLACPPSATYRVRKLVRRHKRTVAVAAVIALLVLTAAAVSTWQAIRLTVEQAKTEAALTAARDALDTMTDDVIEAVFAKQAELEQPEKDFLRKVLEHYEAVAPQVSQTTEARFLRAKGQFKVAHLRGLLGEPAEAIAGYQQAAALLQHLVDEFPEVADYRHKFARTNGNMAILLAEAGQHEQAEKALRQGILLRTKLVDDAPDNTKYRSELAKNYNDLAVLLELRGQPEEAGKGYRQSLELHKKLVADAGDVPEHHQGLARARANLGSWLRKQDKFTEAEPLLRQALKVQKEQLERFPTVPQRRRHLADNYHGLGIVLAELQRPAEAETAFKEMVALRQTLVDDYPRVTEYRRELASSVHDLGYLLVRMKKYADAEKAYRRAVAMAEALVARPKPVASHRQFLVKAYANLAGALEEQKKDAEAEKAYLNALAHQTKLVEEFPRSGQHRDGMAETLMKLALLHQKRKDFAKAVPLLDTARTHLRTALASSPKHPILSKSYRSNLRALAKTHLMLADHAKLAAVADDLAGFGYEAAGDTYDAAGMLSRCAMLATKDAGLARGYTERALAMLRQAVERGFKDAARMKQDPHLEPLRERPEFRELLADLQRKEK